MIAALATGLLLAGTQALAAPDNFDLELEGYYRTRAYMFKGLYLDQDEPGRYMVHRLRFEPTINFEDRAKFTFQTDLLDNAVWGDNASQASTAVFAGDPSATGVDGQETETFQLNRAWMEFQLPIGLVKFGRQPSHWGMGLLANSGDGFDDTFGENHAGATYDRAIFATKPIAVAQAIMGRSGPDVPLFLAVGVDRLVEEPLIQYYGYECDVDLVQGTDDKYDSRCDTDGDGITDLEHGLTDDERTADSRGADWWVDNDDDVMEMIYVLIYKGEDITLAGRKADLTAGVYVVNRIQVESRSDVLIWDAYFRLLWNGIYAEGEVLHIGGETSAVALPGAYDPTGLVADPLFKEADIWGYVARLGYQQESYTMMMETGFASGDDNSADAAFTGRPIHPDHNVGLILYEEILSRVTATTWSDAADGLWSRGGVYNSRYIFPNARFRPMKNWEFIAGYLLAWPDKPDGSRILCAEYDTLNGEPLECAEYKANAKELGWEIDLAVKHRFHDHVLLSLESGYAQASDRIPLENVGLNPDGKFFTVQSRVAYEF